MIDGREVRPAATYALLRLTDTAGLIAQNVLLEPIDLTHLKVALAVRGYLPFQMFDVTIFGRHPGRWEWQVCNRKGAIVMQGWEPTRQEAKYKANSALFLLLSTGWHHHD